MSRALELICPARRNKRLLLNNSQILNSWKQPCIREKLSKGHFKTKSKLDKVLEKINAKYEKQYGYQLDPELRHDHLKKLGRFLTLKNFNKWDNSREKGSVSLNGVPTGSISDISFNSSSELLLLYYES